MNNKRIKRFAAFLLALVLVLNTIINQDAILAVFAQTSESTQQTEEASESKQEATTAEVKDTEQKEETTTEKQEEVTEKKEESTQKQATTTEKKETETKNTTEKKKETTTEKKESTEATTEKKEEKTTETSEIQEVEETSEAEKLQEDPVDTGYTVIASAHTYGTITVEASVNGSKETVTANSEKGIKLTNVDKDSEMTVTFTPNNKAVKITSAKIGDTIVVDSAVNSSKTKTVTVSANTVITADFKKEEIALTKGTEYVVVNEKAEHSITFKNTPSWEFNQYYVVKAGTAVTDSDWKDIDDITGDTKATLDEGKYAIAMRHYVKGDTSASYASESAEVLLDTTAPVIGEITTGKEWLDGTEEIEIPVTDEVSGVESVTWYRNEGKADEAIGVATSEEKDGKITFKILAANIPNGEHTYSFEATDKLNNTSKKTTAITVKKDDSVPTVELENNVDTEKWYGTNDSFVIIAKNTSSAAVNSGIKKVLCIDEKNNEVAVTADTDGKYRFTPEAGDHNYSIQAVSGSGVESDKLKERIKYDKEPPSTVVQVKYYCTDASGKEIDVTNNTDGINVTQKVTIKLYVKDDLSGVDAFAAKCGIRDREIDFKQIGTVKVNGVDYEEFEAKETIKAKELKSEKLLVSIDSLSDLAGNKTTSPITITPNAGFVTYIDKVTPKLSINSIGTSSDDTAFYSNEDFAPSLNVKEAVSFADDETQTVNYEYKVDNKNEEMTYTDASEDHVFTAKNKLTGNENEETEHDISFTYTDASANKLEVLDENNYTLPAAAKFIDNVFSAKVVVDKKAPSIGGIVFGNAKKLGKDELLYAQVRDKAVNFDLSFMVTEKYLDPEATTVTAISDTSEELVIKTIEQEGISELLTTSIDKEKGCVKYSLCNFNREGTWTFIINTQDKAGNPATKTCTNKVVINNSVPELKITYGDKKFDNDTIYTKKEAMSVEVILKDNGIINENEGEALDVKWVGHEIEPNETSFENDKTEYKKSYELKEEGNYSFNVNYTAKNGRKVEIVTVKTKMSLNSEEYSEEKCNTNNDGSYDSINIVVDRTAPVIELNDNSFSAGDNNQVDSTIYLNNNLKNNDTPASLKFNIKEKYLYNDTVKATATANENKVVFELGEGEYKNDSNEVTFDFGSSNWQGKDDGDYHFTITAEDKAGNKAVYAVDEEGVSAENILKNTTIVYDTKAPVMTIKYPETAYTTTDSRQNNNNQNEIFYQEKPTITLTLNEHNHVVLPVENEADENKTEQKAANGFAPVLYSQDNDSADLTASAINFEQQTPGSDCWEATLPINEDKDSHNSFILEYTDLSGNKMEIGSINDDSKTKYIDYGKFDSTTHIYTSPVITVDKTEPIISVTFDEKNTLNANRYTGGSRTYFYKDTVMTITVTEENFRAADFNLSEKVSAYRIEEGKVKKGWEVDNWEKQYYNYLDDGRRLFNVSETKPEKDPEKDQAKNVHIFEIPLSEEWQYDFIYNYKDLAGRSATKKTASICIDKTDPTIIIKDIESKDECDIKFFGDEARKHKMTFFDYVKYGYFGKGKVFVYIEAQDDISGIQYVDIDVTDKTGKSSSRRELNDNADGEKTGMKHDSGNIWYTTMILDEDFKGAVKAKPTDKSGNTPNSYASPRGVVSETKQKHEENSLIKITTHTKPSNTVNGLNYYNTNVSVTVDMKDTHSGLKSWSYKVGDSISANKDYSNDAGTKDKEGNPTVNNVYSQSFDKTMVSDAKGNVNYSSKENPTIVTAEFTDNAGYTSKVKEKYVIDKEKPVIDVKWNPATGMNEKYYKETRTATITVTERNFNEAGVKWDIANRTGVQISGWSHKGDTHVCTVSFTQDGDFLMNFSITDYAMNTSKWKGEEFTIDKTAPVLSITFDNNNASNGHYFNRPRTATLHIEEHNFNAADVKYELSASNDGKGIASPTAGGWSTGSDHHTAAIHYGSDGDYSLNFTYTDMAGNPAKVIAPEKFVIDLTKPIVKIINVKDHSAYNGKVAPGVEYSDTNLDENQVTIRLVGNKVGNADYDKEAPVAIHNGKIIQWEDFKRVSAVDDIYTFEVIAKDKAGNVNDTAKVVFSVNRFGSNYIFGKATEELVNSEHPYTNQEIPIEVTEVNVNKLKEKSVSVRNEDNDIVTLQEKQDYTVTEGNDKYDWKEYKYVLNAANFAEEGQYNVTLSSVDAATNQMDNLTKEKDIEFVVDKTNPTGTISGLEKERYKEDEHEIVVRADDNYGLDKAVLYVDGEEKGSYTAEDFAGANGLPVTLASKSTPQKVSMKLTDWAGNETVIGHGDADKGCLITSNSWIQFYSNKPLFFGTIGVGVVGILSVVGVLTHGFGYAASMAAQTGFWWLILGKKRDDEDEEDN